MLNLSQSWFTGLCQRADLMSVCLTSMIDHSRAALRTFDEKGGIVCVNVHTSAHFSCPLVKQNLWNAEECHFWTGARSYYKQVSPALCSPNITHGLHFHIKASERSHMHAVKLTFFSPSLPSITATVFSGQKLIRVTRPPSIKIFVCKWSVKQIGEQMDTSQPEHL